MKNRKILMLVGVCVLFLLILGLGVTFAYYTARISGSGKTNVITIGSMNVNFTETNVINVTTGAPIYDEDRNADGYKNEFKVNYNGTDFNVDYGLVLKVESIVAKFRSKHLKWELSKNGVAVSNGNFQSVVDGSSITLRAGNELVSGANQTDNYVLTIWLSYSTTEDQSDLLKGNNGATALKGKIIATSTTK